MKRKIQKQMKGNRGITLIALVVTIVVLLILAGITISTLFGDNGIIAAARKAADDTTKIEDDTQQEIQNLANELKEQIGSNTSSLEKLIAYDSFITSAQGNQIVSDKAGKPIIVPVGFKVTNDATEIDKGVVIEDKIGNQYVWVPVSDSQFSDMFGSYGSGNNINYYGKLYNFTTTGKGDILRGYYTTESGTIGIDSNYNSKREPDITNADGSNAAYYADLFTSAIGNITANDFKDELQTKFNDMAKSVKEYKGFYIGRYEASNLDTVHPKTVKGVNPTNNIKWYNTYKNMQGIETYTNSEVQSDVVTNIIWGCQWDRTLDWIATTNTSIGYAGLLNSRTWGNYLDSETFTFTKVDGTTGTKVKNTSTPIPTGSTERNKSNNIYDLAGNLAEWTMESDKGDNAGHRTPRGSRYDSSSNVSASDRDVNGNLDIGFNYIGSRPTLYVKVP